MTTLGFLNPKAGASQSRLILNLGWVLADAGFRVGLVDFDPQAGLSELAGASNDVRGSIHDALAPLLDGGEPNQAELVLLATNLVLVRGNIRMSTFDDVLAIAWMPSADPQASALVHGIAHLIDDIVERGELDVLLCDLGSSLGPLCHAVAAATDAIVVPLAPRTAEDASLRSLASTLRRWRGTSPDTARPEPYRTLGFVMLRPSGVVEMRLEDSAAAYRRELNGEHLGTIKEFPSLVSIARTLHKPEIELTMADGVVGSLSSAVLDLRRQYEALATQIASASGLLAQDLILDRLGQVLYSELEDDLPGELDALSSHTAVQAIDDIVLGSVEVHHGGLRVVGSASVSVTLESGGSRDGLETSMSFPMRFDLELDRSHESATEVHLIQVDTSSFSE